DDAATTLAQRAIRRGLGQRQTSATPARHASQPTAKTARSGAGGSEAPRPDKKTDGDSNAMPAPTTASVKAAKPHRNNFNDGTVIVSFDIASRRAISNAPAGSTGKR